MKKKDLLKKVEHILKNNDREFTAKQLAELLSNESGSIENNYKAILKYKNLLGEDYGFEKDNGLLYFFHINDLQKEYILMIKKILIRNKLETEIVKDFNIMNNIELSILKELRIQQIINSFIKQLMDSKYESKDFLYPPEKFIYSSDIIEDTIKDSPNEVIDRVNFLIDRDSKLLYEKWFSKKFNIQTQEIIKYNQKKFLKIFFYAFLIMASFILLGFFLKDNSFYYTTPLIYILGVIHFKIETNDLKEYFKRLFLFFLIYNFIKSIDIFNFFSIFPYELEYYPDIRLFVVSFFVANIILFCLPQLVSFFIGLKILIRLKIINIFKKFNMSKTKEIKMKIYYHKIIKNSEITDKNILDSFNKFINSFFYTEIKEKKSDKDVSIFKKLIYIIMLSLLVSSYEIPLMNFKKDIYKSYFIKNEICNNIDSKLNVINLKNGSVLLEDLEKENNFKLVYCERKIN